MNPTDTASKADTFLVSCIDPRLTDDTTFYFASLGRAERYSEMRIAGAALAAVDPARPAWATALFENLASSRALHGIRRVTFLNHRDCGAMALWAGRPLDSAEELRLHAQVLNQAAAAVRARHADLEIEIKFMELDGSVQVLPCAACAPGATSGPLRAEAVPPPVGDAAGFGELVRVRLAAGQAPDQAAQVALLSEGVSRYGLTAEAARGVLHAAEAAAGQQDGSRDVAAFLRSRRDAAGRIGSQDLAQGGQLYRRLSGGRLSAQEAARRAAAIAEAEGLAPRPEGIRPFRSTGWFNRLTA